MGNKGEKRRNLDPASDGLWMGVEQDALGFGRRQAIQIMPTTPSTSMAIMAMSTTTTATMTNRCVVCVVPWLGEDTVGYRSLIAR